MKGFICDDNRLTIRYPSYYVAIYQKKKNIHGYEIWILLFFCYYYVGRHRGNWLPGTTVVHLFCSCTALVSLEVNRLSRRQKKRLKTQASCSADNHIKPPTLMGTSLCSMAHPAMTCLSLWILLTWFLVVFRHLSTRLTNHICSSDRRLFQLPYCARLLTCSLSLHYQHFRIH